MFEYTGVDGIMVGRASLGNPWIFKQIIHYLENGEKLPISRNRKEAFGEEYMKYCWDREEAVEV